MNKISVKDLREFLYLMDKALSIDDAFVNFEKYYKGIVLSTIEFYYIAEGTPIEKNFMIKLKDLKEIYEKNIYEKFIEFNVKADKKGKGVLTVNNKKYIVTFNKFLPADFEGIEIKVNSKEFFRYLANNNMVELRFTIFDKEFTRTYKLIFEFLNEVVNIIRIFGVEEVDIIINKYGYLRIGNVYYRFMYS